MIEFLQQFGSVTNLDIENFESDIGRKLPDEYRAFLLQYGGGIIEPSVFSFSIYPGCEEKRELKHTGAVEVFLGLSNPLESNSLQWTHHVLKYRIPDHFLAIANTCNGDSICCALAGDDKGYIYVWRHGESVDEGDTPAICYNVYYIASSFLEFSNSLYILNSLKLFDGWDTTVSEK